MNAVTATAASNDAFDQVERASTISDRLSSELVIAFVGPVASGVSKVIEIFRKTLIDKYEYEVPAPIKISDFITQYADSVAGKLQNGNLDERITSYQTVGNAICERNGKSFLAKCAVRSISQLRHRDGFRKVTIGTEDKDIPIPIRRIYLIDSIKRPEEAAQLREIYGDIFWMVGVSAADHVRRDRLERLGVKPEKIHGILDRDMGEKAEFGQKVRKVFSSSDYFVRNDGENTESIEKSVDRLLDVLFGVSIVTPTNEESAMFSAANAASRSACMSRQVGSAIIDTEGQLIAVGWNDVPKFGGGLYDESPDSAVGDHRCYRWRGKECHNDLEKRLIEDRVVDGIRSEIAKKAAEAPLVEGKRQIPVQLTSEEIRSAVRSSGISALIEFSRAIHAEMAAILAVARDKRHSLKEATMMVTTYPCHNCARHIVAAGITSVVYIEPYEKSLAMKLHPDAVSEDDREQGKKCLFRQFEGFSPRHIFGLFLTKRERKSELGRVVSYDRKSAQPIYRRHLDSFTLYEDKVVDEIS